MKKRNASCLIFCPQQPSNYLARGFSLVEVLIAVFIVTSCILTFAGLLPMTMGRSQESIELVKGKNLLGTIICDIKSKPSTSNVTSLFGIKFAPSTMTAPYKTLYFFDERGAFLGEGQTKVTGTFFIVNLDINKIDDELTGYYLQGQLSINWPVIPKDNNGKMRQKYSIPLSFTYDK